MADASKTPNCVGIHRFASSRVPSDRFRSEYLHAQHQCMKTPRGCFASDQKLGGRVFTGLASPARAAVACARMEPSAEDLSIAALERSLALNRSRQCDLRDEEAAICSQLQELRSSAKQAAKDAAEAQHARVDWTGTFEWDAAVRDMLKSRFGHDSFRPLQREVINATLSRRDTFAILPTGSGKSVNSNSCSEPSAASHRSRADRPSCNDSRPCSCSSSSRVCFLRLV